MRLAYQPSIVVKGCLEMVNEKLLHHSATQFKKDVVELAEGVYTAVGFAASTQHMIIGETSITIIDTSESTAAAGNVLAAFREITDKPVGRIVYTHGHRDHISGASVFAQGREIPILAHADFASDLIAQDADRIAPYDALAQRTKAQFGIGLSDVERVSIGCGPGDRPLEGLGAGFLPPTHMIDAPCVVDLDGVQAELIFAPGETPDHLAIWLPESRVLIPGDNWYHAFPNLYAIRGTPYRDFQVWADTLALLEGYQAEVLAPGHTRPVFGATLVSEVLSTTRSAILHVMDHTTRAMNAGMRYEDIADSLSLPPELAAKPWLGEFYGKASWSARAFAEGTLGWYDGNPTHLGTLSSRKRAAHIAALAGGVVALKTAAQKTDDLQWQLELCDHLTALGEDMAKLKAAALRALAATEVNATARNTYLMEAKRLD